MIYFFRRILFVYFRPYWKQCVLLFLLIVLSISFDSIFPLSIKFLIDLAIIPKDLQMLILLIVGLVVFYIVSMLGSLALDYLNALLVAWGMKDMRLKMFSHLQDLSANYYAHIQSEDVITRFNTDLNTIQTALSRSVVQGIQYGLLLVINTVILFMLNIPLALVTLILLSLTAALPKLLIERAAALTAQRRIQETDIVSTVQESLQAHGVIRMFGLRDAVIAAFTRQSNHFAETTIKSSFAEWLISRTSISGQYLIQLLVIAIGTALVFLGRLSIGSLIGFTTILAFQGTAIALVLDAFAGLIPAIVSLERVECLLNEPCQLSDTPDVPLPRFANQICFDQVTFSYAGPGGQPNLNHVNFTIPYGHAVAIIGRSGSGKSTALNLLMRFYDPCEGRILVDGQNIQRVSLASLRSQMAVVFQETFLFNTTLRENIRIGKLGASDAEVEDAAKAAGVHDTIISLPAGYDTRAGEQGKTLSGGQRQRIALARAILRRPAILLLDEATSALDPETERRINDTLKQLRRTCTIVSVTHRLAPVADMDQIVVLDHGQVAETGTHEALLKRQGLYYHLYTQQSGFTVSSDGQYAEVTPARLRSIPLFEKLDDATLETLATQFVTERDDTGRTVIQEGELGDKFYIIVRGKVSVTALGSDQQSMPIGYWQDGDYFGEIALLEGGRRTATVRTIEPSLFLTLERKHFANMVASSLAVREAVEQAARIRRLDLSQRTNT